MNFKNFKNLQILLFFIIFSFIFIYSLTLAQTNDQNLFQTLIDFFLKKLSLSTDKQKAQLQNIDFKNIPLTKGFLNPNDPILTFEDSVTKIANEASAAVVSIVISKYVPIIERYYINPFDNNFDLPPELMPFFQFSIPGFEEKGYEKKEIGGGTGFIISKDGLVVTNKHVVSDAKAEYTVYLNDGRKFAAKVLALHPNDDLALIKIDANNLPTLTLGDSDNLKLGQFVIAIGNALGEFQNTVSFGVVSGLKRSLVASDRKGSVEKLEGLIQTDAAINFGNSGGPLINLKGEVIGVNTAIAGDAENIGFAIPVNRVKKMIEEYQLKGKIEVPFLGVYYILVNENIKKKFNLSVDYGAYLYKENASAIIPFSPAEKAGLKNGDIILELDNEKITFNNTLSQLILKKKVGQRVNLKVLRDNKEITITVILGPLPENLP